MGERNRGRDRWDAGCEICDVRYGLVDVGCWIDCREEEEEEDVDVDVDVGMQGQ